MASPLAVIEEFIASHDLDAEQINPHTFLITLPGEKKLQTHCALVLGGHSLGINAFVIRKPDENVAAVHEWLLAKSMTGRWINQSRRASLRLMSNGFTTCSY